MDRVNMFLSFRRIVLTSIFTIALCFAGSTGLSAQEGEDLVDPVTPAATEVAENSGAQGSQNRVLELLFTGDPLGIAIIALIILLSFVSVYFIIEHMLSISKRKLMPEDVLAELEQRIARGEINQAIEFCYQPENYSLISDVILAGLERYQSSEFGFAEYKSAVEEAGEDFTGRLYRKTEVLNVIGQISPMLGLTGTVLGMISAFMTIAEKEGMAKPEELAGGIGEALITTLLGLLVAIPTLVALSYFRNKIDSLVAEAGKRVERALLPLARKRS
ncbi:MAG: MotA/TolQ/ExbB proton channel family protein [Planctomycetota bacterium]|nr:MotA/TolQ/ExbB proton channel family protein [Planctomycetota bacterium]